MTADISGHEHPGGGRVVTVLLSDGRVLRIVGVGTRDSYSATFGGDDVARELDLTLRFEALKRGARR